MRRGSARHTSTAHEHSWSWPCFNHEPCQRSCTRSTHERPPYFTTCRDVASGPGESCDGNSLPALSLGRAAWRSSQIGPLTQKSGRGQSFWSFQISPVRICKGLRAPRGFLGLLHERHLHGEEAIQNRQV